MMLVLGKQQLVVSAQNAGSNETSNNLCIFGSPVLPNYWVYEGFRAGVSCGKGNVKRINTICSPRTLGSILMTADMDVVWLRPKHRLHH